MSSPPAHRDCFLKRLPKLTENLYLPYRSVGASGATTRNAIPPERLENALVDKLESAAIGYLTRFQNDPASIRQISSTFPYLTLDSENDVVTASYTYIILPIMEVLRIYFKDRITLHTELTEKAAVKVDRIVNGKQEIVDSVIRYDLVFKSSPGTLSPPKTIAVLEYKRRNMLRYKDFGKSIVPQNPTTKDINDFEYRLGQSETGTLLEFNGISYSKQASQYASTTKCKHVALFDWNNLVLFNYKDITKSTAPFTAGQKADVSWICEISPSGAGNFVQIKIIRKVLLGWMLQALNDAGLT